MDLSDAVRDAAEYARHEVGHPKNAFLSYQHRPICSRSELSDGMRHPGASARLHEVSLS
jgi:hypothetical protein